ncbi:uncharacterized protein LOC126320379 isoform X2 [Schistocerca gregaria]|uniref:uncharacterized protein LOC126320379 isoform X2 n=1 Tax=Schistocerca gregaria TaxID=7010 RepID=UPI00211DDA22|nr:uncharacterized protein LOC126320379 isoform X2 [Schistocerca gregaria]
MSSSSICFTKVTFTLKARTETVDQNVFLVGDTPYLGSWIPHQAIKMKKTHVSVKNIDTFVWKATVHLPVNIPVSYKYVIMGDNRLIKWETNSHNIRNLIPLHKEMNVDDGEFGQDADNAWIDEAWLNNEIQIRISLGYYDPLTGDPFPPVTGHASDRSLYLHLFDPSRVISRKLTRTSWNSWSEIVFHTHDLSQFQVNVEACEINPDEKDESLTECICMTCITGGILKDRRNYVSLPLFNSKMVYCGLFNFKYLIVMPFKDKLNNMSFPWNLHSESQRPIGKSVGHRGCGSTKTTVISENTIFSFLTAANYGADYIEFDVQITKDGVPVINHDFHLCAVNYLGKQINVHISSLTKKEFKMLRPEHKYCDYIFQLSRSALRLSGHIQKSRSLNDLNKSSSEDESASRYNPKLVPSRDTIHGISDLSRYREPPGRERNVINPRDTFATLSETFCAIPVEIGFVIEIKYPSYRYQHDAKMLYHERNFYVDAVLRATFAALANPLFSSRKIMFISFDADICILLSQKQPRYPVLFLLSLDPTKTTENNEVEQYDIRCKDFDVALNFAKNVRLQGLICDAGSILSNLHLVKKTHEKGLLLMTYGEQNMKEECRKTQKNAGVDSLIIDNVLRFR